MVVSIILSILKIIGITLLCILGLVLLVALLVLFVPIRYKVTADGNINENEKEYHLKVSVSWLLWFVRGKYELPSEDGFIVKVGPFCVYGKKEKPEKKEKRRKNASKNKASLKTRPSNENSIDESFEDIPDIEEEDDTKETESTEEFAESPEIEKESKTEKKKRKTLKEKILYTRQKIYDKINKIRTKIKDIIKNIKKYVAILQSDEFQEAFSLCKESVVRLFCMIKPRTVKINGKAGLTSPEQTGYMCAAVGVISPFFKNRIQIEPDFEQFIIKGNALIKGRIYVFVILIIAIKMFFDNNIRKVIEMFRREES